MKPIIEVDGNELHLQVFDCVLEHGASRFRSITLNLSDIPDVIEALQSVSGPTPVAARKCPSCSGSGRYQPNYPTNSRACLACGGTGKQRITNSGPGQGMEPAG